eukprot:4944051-Pyramimonas_sp.AAC.1
MYALDLPPHAEDHVEVAVRGGGGKVLLAKVRGAQIEHLCPPEARDGVLPGRGVAPRGEGHGAPQPVQARLRHHHSRHRH